MSQLVVHEPIIVGTGSPYASLSSMARAVAVTLAFAVVSSIAAAQERVVQPIPAQEMRPGYGVVESVRPVTVSPHERSAAAGGSAPSSDAARPVYRVGVRLADGTLQYRDLDKPEFKVGDNVLLTNAGDVVPD
jgi:hypothetical protein